MALPSRWEVLGAIVAVGLSAALWRYVRKSLRQSLKGKAVVVTGCDSGLGWAILQRLVSEHALVFATCLTPEGLKKCGDLGENVVPIRVDIRSDDEVAQLVAKVESELKKRGLALTGLVNNAGLGNYGFAEALDLKRYKDVLDVNCLGTVRVTKGLLHLLRAHGEGARLVTIGSLSDRLPAGFGSAYVPSKAYVTWFTESVGFETRRFGIRAAIIEPGFIATELLDAGQQGGAKACESMSADVKKAYGDFAPMMAKVREPVMLCEKLNGGKTGGGAKVADATVDALSSTWPRSRYLVGYEASILAQLPRFPGWTRFMGVAFAKEHRAVHP